LKNKALVLQQLDEEAHRLGFDIGLAPVGLDMELGNRSSVGSGRSSIASRRSALVMGPVEYAKVNISINI